MRSNVFVALGLLASACAGEVEQRNASGVEARESTSPDARADELVHLFLDQADARACMERGEQMLATRASDRVRAWTLVCRERVLEDGSGIAAAQAWATREPNSRWPTFARLAAKTYDDHTPAEVAQLRSGEGLDVGQADVAWLRTVMLVDRARRFGVFEPEEGLAHAEGMTGAFGPTRRCVRAGAALRADVAEAENLDIARGIVEAAVREHGADPCTLREIVSFSGDVPGLEQPGLAAAMKQFALQPWSTRATWSVAWRLAGDETLDADTRADLAIETIERLLERRPDDPKALKVAHFLAGTVGDEARQQTLHDALFRDHPDAVVTAWLRVDDFRAASGAIWEREPLEVGAEDVRGLQARYAEFVAHPRPLAQDATGNMQMTIASLALEVEPPMLDVAKPAALGCAETMVLNPWIVFGFVPLKLVEHGEAETALEIAELGIARIEEDEGKEPERQIGPYAMRLRAYALAELGRWDEARATLGDARARGYPETNIEHFIRGRVAWAAGDLDAAEAALIEAHLANGPGRPDVPTKAQLEALHVERKGSRRGLKRYMAGIESRGRDLRKTEVLGARIDEPRRRPDFELTDLAGEVRGSADFDGKVAVVHFWAPWCGWCLPELGHYQALARAYPGEDVAFLSVVSDTLPEDLASFMDEHDYDFAAALDGGAAMGWGVGSWPTTWFLDREGRIVFEQRGYSPHLEEEFRWRIDALLAD